MSLGSGKRKDQLDAARLEPWTFPSSPPINYKYSKEQVYIMKDSVAKELI